MRADRLTWAVVALAALVWIVPLQLVGWWADTVITDIPVYRDAADRMLDGALPYADFALEYPPLAAVIFLIPALLPIGYEVAFSGLMLLALCATAVGAMAISDALGFDRRRRIVVGVGVALTPLLLGNLVESRYDLAMVALVTWTVYAAVTGRFRWMWALLALAVLIKLAPLVLAPVLAIHHARRRGPRAAGRGALAGAAIVAAGVIPFLILSPAGTADAVRYHVDRPLQIESTGSAYLLALNALADVPVRITTSFGSQGIPAQAADVIAAGTTAAALVAVAAIAVTFLVAGRGLRPPGDGRLLVAAAAATIAAALAGGKVLSPQFMLWLVPLGFLIAGRFAWGAAIATALTLILTQSYFPHAYFDLVALDRGPIALLVIRDAMLIGLVAFYWPRPSVATRPEGRFLWFHAGGERAERAVSARYLAD